MKTTTTITIDNIYVIRVTAWAVAMAILQPEPNTANDSLNAKNNYLLALRLSNAKMATCDKILRAGYMAYNDMGGGMSEKDYRAAVASMLANDLNDGHDLTKIAKCTNLLGYGALDDKKAIVKQLAVSYAMGHVGRVIKDYISNHPGKVHAWDLVNTGLNKTMQKTITVKAVKTGDGSTLAVVEPMAVAMAQSAQFHGVREECVLNLIKMANPYINSKLQKYDGNRSEVYTNYIINIMTAINSIDITSSYIIGVVSVSLKNAMALERASAYGVTPYKQMLLKKIAREKDELAIRGIPVTAENIAIGAGVTPETVKKALETGVVYADDLDIYGDHKNRTGRELRMTFSQILNDEEYKVLCSSLDGYTQDEIAERVGCSVRKIRMLIASAKQKLAKDPTLLAMYGGTDAQTSKQEKATKAEAKSKAEEKTKEENKEADAIDDTLKSLLAEQEADGITGDFVITDDDIAANEADIETYEENDRQAKIAAAMDKAAAEKPKKVRENYEKYRDDVPGIDDILDHYTINGLSIFECTTSDIYDNLPDRTKVHDYVQANGERVVVVHHDYVWDSRSQTRHWATDEIAAYDNKIIDNMDYAPLPMALNYTGQALTIWGNITDYDAMHDVLMAARKACKKECKKAIEKNKKVEAKEAAEERERQVMALVLRGLTGTLDIAIDDMTNEVEAKAELPDDWDDLMHYSVLELLTPYYADKLDRYQAYSNDTRRANAIAKLEDEVSDLVYTDSTLTEDDLTEYERNEINAVYSKYNDVVAKLEHNKDYVISEYRASHPVSDEYNDDDYDLYDYDF